jgi:hypothetical protein
MDTQTKNGRPKLELQLNQTVTLTLMKDKPYTGESSYGPYFLYQVRDQAGAEYSFFAPAEIHQQILEAGLKAGDSFQLTKKAMQNGRKVSTKLEFEAVKKNGAAPVPQQQQKKQDEVPFDGPDDGFRKLMELSLRDAIEATKAVNTVQWDVDSIRGIALTIFIQRARG